MRRSSLLSQLLALCPLLWLWLWSLLQCATITSEAVSLGHRDRDGHHDEHEHHPAMVIGQPQAPPGAFPDGSIAQGVPTVASLFPGPAAVGGPPQQPPPQDLPPQFYEGQWTGLSAPGDKGGLSAAAASVSDSPMPGLPAPPGPEAFEPGPGAGSYDPRQEPNHFYPFAPAPIGEQRRLCEMAYSHMTPDLRAGRTKEYFMENCVQPVTYPRVKSNPNGLWVPVHYTPKQEIPTIANPTYSWGCDGCSASYMNSGGQKEEEIVNPEIKLLRKRAAKYKRLAQKAREVAEREQRLNGEKQHFHRV